jgi:hypothetical protein
MEKPKSRLISKETVKQEPSGLKGESSESAPSNGESEEKITKLHVDMRIQQRDAPDKQWHTGDIFLDRNIVLLRRSDGATVSKKADEFMEQLNTPGSPWSQRR